MEGFRLHNRYNLCLGIESGAHHAMYWSDEAIICTNPETSSVRDSDKMIGIVQRCDIILYDQRGLMLILHSKSKKAMQGIDVKLHLLITRYSPERAEAGTMLPVSDIVEMLRVFKIFLFFPLPPF